MVVRQFALLDPAEQADGANRVLVDRIVMIHVELHLRIDAGRNRGTNLPSTPASFHPAQDHFGIVPACQQVEEQGIGARVFLDRRFNKPGIAICLAHGFGVDFQAFLFGDPEYLDQPDRIVPEPVVSTGRAILPP